MTAIQHPAIAINTAPIATSNAQAYIQLSFIYFFKIGPLAYLRVTGCPGEKKSDHSHSSGFFPHHTHTPRPCLLAKRTLHVRKLHAFHPAVVGPFTPARIHRNRIANTFHVQSSCAQWREQAGTINERLRGSKRGPQATTGACRIRSTTVTCTFSC